MTSLKTTPKINNYFKKSPINHKISNKIESIGLPSQCIKCFNSPIETGFVHKGNCLNMSLVILKIVYVYVYILLGGITHKV